MMEETPSGLDDEEEIDPFTELNKLVQIPNPSFNALSEKNGKMGRRRRRRS